jgi:hypothetical protein
MPNQQANLSPEHDNIANTVPSAQRCPINNVGKRQLAQVAFSISRLRANRF